MATNKTALSRNIPQKSSLNDISKEFGFSVELEVAADDNAPARKPQYDMTLGEHMVRAIRLEQVDTVFAKNRYGEEFEIPAHWEILWQDIKDPEQKHIMSIALDRKAEDNFKRALNLRSKRDLGSKLADKRIELTSISFKTAVQYAHKFPVKMNFDFSEWVDRDTNELRRSAKPKLQLWNREDFEDNRPRKNISLD